VPKVATRNTARTHEISDVVVWLGTVLFAIGILFSTYAWTLFAWSCRQEEDPDGSIWRWIFPTTPEVKFRVLRPNPNSHVEWTRRLALSAFAFDLFAFLVVLVGALVE
jgi:hypothetical protein